MIMPQKYKVFYNDSLLEIAPDKSSPKADPVPSSHGEWEELIHSLWEAESPLTILRRSSDPVKSLAVLKSHFVPVEAAGGVVLNDEGEMLAIHRLGKWDLPKGKVEEGEDLVSAAVREVEEECGIDGPLPGEKILETYHLYPREGKRWFKTTHWYLMSFQGREDLVPQVEEDIEKVEWIPVSELAEFHANTYPNVRMVLEEVFDQSFTAEGTNKV